MTSEMLCDSHGQQPSGSSQGPHGRQGKHVTPAAASAAAGVLGNCVLSSRKVGEASADDGRVSCIQCALDLGWVYREVTIS